MAINTPATTVRTSLSSLRRPIASSVMPAAQAPRLPSQAGPRSWRES